LRKEVVSHDRGRKLEILKLIEGTRPRGKKKFIKKNHSLPAGKGGSSVDKGARRGRRGTRPSEKNGGMLGKIKPKGEEHRLSTCHRKKSRYLSLSKCDEGR